jgi:hypothetical protein
MKRENLINQIWLIAAEIAETEKQKAAFGHFYTKYGSKTKSPEDIVGEATKNLGTPEPVNQKIQAKNTGVLDAEEFEEVVGVFRLLMKWRDEKKNQVGLRNQTRDR